MSELRSEGRTILTSDNYYVAFIDDIDLPELDTTASSWGNDH